MWGDNTNFHWAFYMVNYVLKWGKDMRKNQRLAWEGWEYFAGGAKFLQVNKALEAKAVCIIFRDPYSIHSRQADLAALTGFNIAGLACKGLGATRTFFLLGQEQYILIKASVEIIHLSFLCMMCQTRFQ